MICYPTNSVRISLFALAILNLGCVTRSVHDKQEKFSSMVWPSPPATPRIAYVQSIYTPLDLGVRLSWWRKGINLLTGSAKGREPLTRPYGLALDEQDNLCLTDPGAGAVGFFDHARKRFYRWETVGNIRFHSPVAVAKRGDTIFVADSALGKVVAFRLDGTILFEIDNEVERPSGLALSKDTLFVTDAAAHRIYAFDLHGTFLSQFGRRGSDPGRINFPTHMTILDRVLYVTDTMNFRIQMMSETGEFQRMIGQMGDGSGHLSRPKGVAVDKEKHVYVVDALFDNVQIFDATGRFLLHWGESGPGPGEFWLPAGICISQNNKIFVADSYNHRIQVFQYLGAQ